jgi:hypothetical protein
MALVGVALGTVTAVAFVGGERLLSSPSQALAHAPSAAPSSLPAARRTARVETPAPVPQLDPTPELPHPSADEPRPRAPEAPAPRAEQSTPAAPDRSVASFPLPRPTELDAGAALESRRVAEARAHLRSGDARGALALLDALRRDYPQGVLAQERDALAVEALLALGERAKARALAAQFLVRYPASPHAASVKRALE